MHLRLHANATTTPRTRAYIQKSTASDEALARELGVHRRTVARWRARQDVADRSTRPHRLATPITEWEEGLIVELRRSLALPLDDIVEAMRRCVNPRLSRSGIHRCLQRHGLSARLTPQKAPAVAFQTDHVFHGNTTAFEFNLADRMRRDHRGAFNHTKARHLRAHDKSR